MPPSKIGIVLRDQYGIPLVKPIAGKSITEIIAENDLKPAVPKDLNNLLTKANKMTRHLSRNKSDATNKHSLELIVSKIRRLAKYYKNIHSLPENWEYKAEVVAT